MPAKLTLTDELEAALVKAVEAGVPIETAATAARVSPAQFYAWLRCADTGQWLDGTPVAADTKVRIALFAERVAGAQANFEARQVQGVAAAAEAVNAKTGLTDWRARAWLLNNHPRYRKTYRQERETVVTTTGRISHEHTLVSQATPEQLAEWAALELPEPYKERAREG